MTSIFMPKTKFSTSEVEHQEARDLCRKIFPYFRTKAEASLACGFSKGQLSNIDLGNQSAGKVTLSKLRKAWGDIEAGKIKRTEGGSHE